MKVHPTSILLNFLVISFKSQRTWALLFYSGDETLIIYFIKINRYTILRDNFLTFKGHCT
jgi:hypothetical protein